MGLPFLYPLRPVVGGCPVSLKSPTAVRGHTHTLSTPVVSKLLPLFLLSLVAVARQTVRIDHRAPVRPITHSFRHHTQNTPPPGLDWSRREYKHEHTSTTIASTTTLARQSTHAADVELFLPSPHISTHLALHLVWPRHQYTTCHGPA